MRGCARLGIGVPPLCDVHTQQLYPEDFEPDDDPIKKAVEQILQHPGAQGVFENLNSKIDGFASFLGQAFKGGRMPRTHGVREPRQGPPPPPRQAPAFDARKVMGFAPGPLTQEQIKKRYRELAKKFHPDKGGDQAKMVLINRARDALMEELGG